MGYSGTSTGEGLTIKDSVWRNNKAGIVPNTLGQSDPPQRGSRIINNEVYENNSIDAPSVQYTYMTLEMGIVLWGGSDNVVAKNKVMNHGNFGIVAEANIVEPSGNVIRDNVVRGSGKADLALGTPAGDGNVFEGNEFETSRPRRIESDAASGDNRVSAVFEAQSQRAKEESQSDSYRDQPEPDDQPTMSDPECPPASVGRDVSIDS